MNAAAVLLKGKEPGEAELSGRYWTITVRIALEMVAAGEAEAIEIQSPDNGPYIGYVETELGMSRRIYTRRQVRDLSCSMGVVVTEGAANGVEKYSVLVDAWYGQRHVPASRQRCREQHQESAV